MEEFGNFLSNQYALIKQVLKFLPNRDLFSARNVCRSWRTAVDSLLEKHPLWAFSNEGIANFDRRVRPKLILLYADRPIKNTYKCGRSIKVAGCHSDSFCICKNGDENTTMCVLECPKHLFTPLVDDHNKRILGEVIQRSAMLALPEMPGVEFSTFHMSYKELITFVEDEDTENSVETLIGKGGGPLKCLLLFSTENYYPEEMILDAVLRKIEKCQKERFAVGGGVLGRMSVIESEGRSTVRPQVLGIAIKGRNVTAHSEILVDASKDNINVFMEKMADRLGPAPEDGKSRIAFIVQCLNKYRNIAYKGSRLFLCEYEMKSFMNHFPSVPIFGFMGYGEFGLDLAAEEKPVGHQAKKKKISHSQKISLTDSSSIVVVTFNKSKEQQSSSSKQFT